jgi:hypothetical protein
MVYVECDQCGSLLCMNGACQDPDWLDEAYACADDANDAGAPGRAAVVARLVDELIRCGLVPADGHLLDYGSGSGVLAKLLGERGHRVSCYDPFRPGVTDVPKGTYAGVFLIEVLEHLLSPNDVMRNIAGLLEPKAPLLISTVFYRKGFTKDWDYLASDFGQHVTFFTAKGLSILGSRAGLLWAHSVDPAESPSLYVHMMFKERMSLDPSISKLANAGFRAVPIGPR